MRRSLVGRKAEATQLIGTLTDGAVRGVLVTGAAGVGKSRLVREVLAVLQQHQRETEWVVGSHSASTIPFGALAHLLPRPASSESQQLSFLQHAEDVLRERAEGAGMVLAVDDAHLLDPGSATLLHRLATGQVLRLLVTVRSGEPAPDAVTRLVEDDLLEHLPLEPLTREAADRLVTDMLGGDVAPSLEVPLWELALGNPLVLRELARDGRDQGWIVKDRGIWRLEGTPAPGLRLWDLVTRRLHDLCDAERGVVELLAFGGPLEGDVAKEGSPAGTVESLQLRDLVVNINSRGRRLMDLSHPVYGEVLRDSLPRTRRREVYRDLAKRLEQTHLRRHDDVLRLATWAVEGGSEIDAELLLQAAWQAHLTFDQELAERLGQAAAATGRRFEACLVLAEARSHQFMLEEAATALEDAWELAEGEQDKGRVAVAHAQHLFFRAGDPAEGVRLLEHNRAATSDPDVRDRLDASLAMFAAIRGDLHAASDAGRRLLARIDPVAEALVAVLLVSTLADAMLGRMTAAVDAVEVGLRHADEARHAAPLGEQLLRINRTVAWGWGGELERAHHDAREGLREAVARGAIDVAGVWGWALAEVLVLQGRLSEADLVLTDAAAVLTNRDPLLIRPSVLAKAAVVTGMRGDTQRLKTMRPEISGDPAPFDTRATTLRARAQTWYAVAEADLATAAAAAVAAGEIAAGHTQLIWAALAYHDAVRLGHPQEAAGPLRRLASQMDSRLVAVFSAHATAIGDAEALDDVSKRFEQLGADLYAAEAAAQAAPLHHRAGRTREVTRAGARARTLALSCPGAATPALKTLGGAALTGREREIARLAITGMASQEIADQLVLSPRTVNNHLGAVYRKLGIGGRQGLEDVLGP